MAQPPSRDKETNMPLLETLEKSLLREGLLLRILGALKWVFWCIFRPLSCHEHTVDRNSTYPGGSIGLVCTVHGHAQNVLGTFVRRRASCRPYLLTLRSVF